MGGFSHSSRYYGTARGIGRFLVLTERWKEGVMCRFCTLLFPSGTLAEKTLLTPLSRQVQPHPRHRQAPRKLPEPPAPVSHRLKPRHPNKEPIRRLRHLQWARTSVPYLPDHLPRPLMIPACRKHYCNFGHRYNGASRPTSAENRTAQATSGQRSVHSLESRTLRQEIPHRPSGADAPQNNRTQNAGHPDRDSLLRHLIHTAYIRIIKMYHHPMIQEYSKTADAKK